MCLCVLSDLCVCTCVCTCVCVRVYVYVYVCMCTCVYVFVYVCVCVFILLRSNSEMRQNVMCYDPVLMILQLVLNALPQYDYKYVEKLFTFLINPKGRPTK